MGIKNDISGNKYGLLTVIKYTGKNDSRRHSIWLCQCDCGNQINVSRNNLVSGNTSSCGCMNMCKKTHGMTDTRLYRIWRDMKTRTTYTCKGVAPSYIRKNIQLCDEWKTPSNFIEWALNNGYQDNLTIDRIDNNKGYFPENCRWVGVKAQARNRDTNRFITYKGQTKTIADWADELGIDYSKLYRQINKYSDIERAFTTQ